MKSSAEYDFLVVGGGPAGAACATLLAQNGARVALVEASTFTRFRIGETIQSSVRPLLARLKLSIDERVDWLLPSAGVASVWGSPVINGTSSILNPYGRGWRIDRREFDRLLFEHAGTASATTFMGSRLSEVRREGGWWQFSLRSGGCRLGARSAFVVEATGRKGHSPFAHCTRRFWVDRLLGIAVLGQWQFSTDSLSASTLVESVPSGWLYSVSLPGGRALAVFFTDRDLLPRRKASIGPFVKEQLLLSELTRDRCSPVKERLENNEWLAFDARSSIRRTVANDGWIAAGDALMAFDPLCGRGVIDALQSGIEVAERLLDQSIAIGKGDHDWFHQSAIRFNEFLMQRLATYNLETRWSGYPFWKRRNN